MPVLAQCPAFEQDEKSGVSPAALMGTVVHEALERTFTLTEVEFDGEKWLHGACLEKALMLYRNGLAQHRHFVQEDFPTIFKETEVRLSHTFQIGDESVELAGTADLLRVYRESAGYLVLHVLDWKTTWLPGETGDPSDSLQMLTYGLLALLSYQQIKAFHGLPDIDGLRLDFAFLRMKAQDLKPSVIRNAQEFMQHAQTIVEGVLRQALLPPEQRRRTMNSHCRYCALATDCPAYTGEIRKFFTSLGKPEVAAELQNPDKLAELWQFSRELDKAAKTAKDIVRGRVETRGPLVGQRYELGLSSRTRRGSITDDLVKLAALKAGIDHDKIEPMLKLLEELRGEVPFHVVTLKKRRAL